MNIYEYADIISADIKLIRYTNQNNRWSAMFAGCEVKEGQMLASKYGNGKDPDSAIRDYVLAIQGKRIVFNAMDKEHRREYTVPSTLTP